MLANYGQADAEAQACAAAGALGGVKGIEKARNGFRANANAVILESDGDTRAGAGEANLYAARFAHFSNGLFGIGDQIEKDLNELIRVGNHAGIVRLRTEIHFDAISAERVFVQLHGAVDNAVEIDGFFLGRSGARKFEKILNDARGAARLAMRY